MVLGKPCRVARGRVAVIRRRKASAVSGKASSGSTAKDRLKEAAREWGYGEDVPRVDAFFAWLVERAPHHPPKSPMGKAVRYAQKQETALRLFLLDPRIGLDNNVAERALKPVALGRKNFLFAGHDEGAENLAKLQTVVATCQRHGVDPQGYLEDVLVRINTHPGKDLAALLPWNWKPPP